jgi:hypothetical protein
MTPEVTPEPCDRCWCESIGEVGEERLCESCYHAESACCGNFGDEQGCTATKHVIA